MRAALLLPFVAVLAACAERPSVPEALVPDLAEALPSLQRVQLEQGGTTLVFERAGDTWRIDGAEWRADRRWLQPLLLGLAQARCDEPRTAEPARFARIGVDWPPAPATSGADGAFARPTGRLFLEIGGRETGIVVGFPQSRGGTFVRVEGAPHSCLTAATLRLPARTSEWFDPHLWAITPAQLASVSVEDPGSAPVRLVRRDDRFVVEGQVLALTPMPDALVAALAAPRQVDLRPRPAGDDATAAPQRVLRLVIEEGVTYALGLRREGEQTWAQGIDVPEADRAAFAGREFLLPPDVADPLWTSREDLGAL